MSDDNKLNQNDENSSLESIDTSNSTDNIIQDVQFKEVPVPVEPQLQQQAQETIVSSDISEEELPKRATPQKTKGGKIFLLICAIVLLLSLIFGGISFLVFYNITSYSSSSQTESLPDGSPSLTIYESGKSDTTVPIVKNGTPEKLTVPQIAAKVNPSVVGITSSSLSGSSGSGTGIVMNEDGYIVTNNHVIDGFDILTVVTHDGKQYTAEVIGADEKTDLAVIKFTPDNDDELFPAEFGNSDNLVVGDIAITIGNPGGLELQGTLTGGYISAINRDILVEDRLMTLIQTDASINPGNSGGPLINEYGQVVGINTIKISSSSYEGLGFAIPINSAKPIIDELIAYGYVRGRPSIGISGQNISKEFAYYNNIPQGLLVSSVDSRSDAYKKGLKTGDIIVGVNGTETVSITEVNAIKDQFKAGDTITLNVFRSGKTIDIKVVLMDEAELQQYAETEQQNSNSNQYTNPWSWFGN